MIETHRCDDKEQLVAFLYDEIDPAARRRIEEHLRSCAACAAEVGGLGEARRVLAEWHPPDTALEVAIPPVETAVRRNGSLRPHAAAVEPVATGGAEIVRPARWWRPAGLPAWAQAAAAVLVVAAGLAIANIQVRYDANGLVVTTGWMRPAAPAPAEPSGGQAIPASGAAPDEGWRTALASLEQELRGEIASTRPEQPARVSVPPSDAASLERVSALIEESERRQKRELALRLTQVVRDMELQRRTDNRRNVQAIGQFEGLAGAEMLRQRQALDYIMRVFTQPPPQ